MQTWKVAYLNQGVRDWLFRQKNSRSAARKTGCNAGGLGEARAQFSGRFMFSLSRLMNNDFENQMGRREVGPFDL
jgi:hypothetical protein